MVNVNRRKEGVVWGIGVQPNKTNPKIRPNSFKSNIFNKTMLNCERTSFLAAFLCVFYRLSKVCWTGELFGHGEIFLITKKTQLHGREMGNIGKWLMLMDEKNV